MKWFPTDCQSGDIIRVKIGAVYHYGIFISEDEVVQFGVRPDRHPSDLSEIAVLATSIQQFADGDIVEVGQFDKEEKRKKRSPQQVVSIARSCIGEKGYDILHNNCEHFVNRCVFGRGKCEQADEVRRMWQNRPMFKVYFAQTPTQVDNDVFPKLRLEEIESTTNVNVKCEKYGVWKLLEFALLHAFGTKITDLQLKKDKFGRWTSDKHNFSMSHSGGIVCVAVSNGEVGVDVEDKQSFEKRFADDEKRSAMMAKISTKKEKSLSDDTETLLRMWTAKESLFKCNGKGNFHPEKIDIDAVKSVQVSLLQKDYCVSFCGKYADKAEFYFKTDAGVKKLIIQ